MKKYSLILAVVLVFLSAVTSHATVEVVCFDSQFIRNKGKPFTEFHTFPGISGPATLKLTNDKISSATISVNGIEVFGPSNFNKKVSYLEAIVTLNQGDNILEALLKSKPGGKIRIEILQEVDADAASFISPEGGVVEVTDPESPIYGVKIEFPAGAIDENIVLTMTEKPSENDLPEEATSAGKVIDFGPDGMFFNSEITITMPYEDRDNDGFVDGTAIPENLVTAVSYNKELSSWLFLEKTEQDVEGNTVTFTTDRFSVKETVALDPSKFGRDDVAFFTIDGCELLDILPDWFEISYRPEYLMPALLWGMDLGLKPADVYSYSNRVGDDWTGDPNDTEDVMSNLILKMLSENRKAKVASKKFCVMTHSWGTVLAFFALSYTNIKPDLFITLSSPLGTEYNNEVPWWGRLPIMNYLNEQFNDCWWHQDLSWLSLDSPHYTKWINYWAFGDIFSGPISNSITLLYKNLFGIVKDFSFNVPGIENKIVDNKQLCNIGTTVIYHAITSLDARGTDTDGDGEPDYLPDHDGKWKSELDDDYALAVEFRDIVRNDIVLELELDNDTDGDRVPDSFDNCPDDYNPAQADSDEDGIGDACDTGPTKRYTVIEIVHPLGSAVSLAKAINNSGQVVGGSDAMAFLWSETEEWTWLYILPDGTSAAYDINDSGQVVVSASKSGETHAFLWENGVITDLGEGYAYAINDSSQTVGTSGGYAVLWENGSMINLGTFGGMSEASGINNFRQVVGSSEISAADHHAFLWDNGIMTNLGTLGGIVSFAYGINDSAQVVGESWDESGHNSVAFLWQNGVMTELPMTKALSINMSGQVVGYLGEQQTRRACLWEDGAIIDLNDVIDPSLGFTLEVSTDINDVGQIVGWGTINGETHAFLLTPVP